MLRGMLTHPLHDSDPELNNLRSMLREYDNLSNMLRGMFTHPPHVLLRDMPNPLSLGKDSRYNKIINMSR
eukprot:13651271-Ditylum_brightwellii.AAC.1